MTTYSTKAEAIEREITPALGEWVGDYDIDGIARDLLVWHVDHDERGRELLNTAGYAVRDDADFWAIVQAHEVAHTGTRTAREDLRALGLFLAVTVPIVLVMIGAMALGISTTPTHTPAAVTQARR